MGHTVYLKMMLKKFFTLEHVFYIYLIYAFDVL